MYDWLYMCWVLVMRDFFNGVLVMIDCFLVDFVLCWFCLENDFFGDLFFFYVNLVFWLFYGWIDDCIEDWYCVYECFYFGEVQCCEVEGI